MKTDLLDLIAAEQPYPLIFATVSGAHLYGFPSPDSDYDLRGAHCLPLPKILGLEKPKLTIESSGFRGEVELDIVTHDIAKFMGLMLKKNGYVLEQLYSPLVVRTGSWHQELKELGEKCITKHHAHHYLGFGKTQLKLIAKSNPPKVKPLLYLLRVDLTGIHLMRTGRIEANLKVLNQEAQLPYLEELITYKTEGTEQGTIQGINPEFLLDEHRRLVGILEEEQRRSKLPNEETAKAGLNDLLIRIRLHGEE